jgi:hypothetical protein
MILWQTFFDRIDPINYDGMLVKRPPPGTASKHVMLTWGRDDTFSPESTLTNTAIAAGVLQASPALVPIVALTFDQRPVTMSPGVAGGDGPTRFGAVFQYDGQMAFDGHFVALQLNQAISDWRAFFVSVAAGAPAVP